VTTLGAFFRRSGGTGIELFRLNEKGPDMPVTLKTLAILSATLSLIVGAAAHASIFGASGSAVSSSISGSLDSGLCMNTPTNQESKQINNGYCQQLADNLSGIPSCLSSKVEQLRQNALNGNPPQGLDEFCGNWRSIAENPVQWQNFILNYLAALFNEESHWDDDAKNPIAVSYTGQHAQGLCQLSVDSVQAYKCGCDPIDSSADLNDPNKSLTCGADVALTNMVKTNAMGDGSGGSKGRSGTTTGAARYFEPLRSSSDKRQKIVAKMNFYCSSSGSTYVASTMVPGEAPNPNFNSVGAYEPLLFIAQAAATAIQTSRNQDASRSRK
jgi:hypothetical protein